MSDPIRSLPALLAAALVAAPGPVASQGDSMLLDGPCVDREAADTTYGELLEERRRAREAAGGDSVRRLREAIRIQKQAVRLQCDNPWRWMKLAELYLEAGRADDAVAVIDHVEPWAANTIERASDGYWKPLEELRETEAFRGSELARRMEQRREARRERLEPIRGVLDTLGPGPPERYVARGACPFECCVYRTWHVLSETRLVSKVGGDSVVATLAAGDTVEGLTGEVHVRPAPVAVVHRPKHEDRIRPGEIVYLLDYVGEGFHHVWHHGEILQTETSPGVRSYCPIPDPECWGELLDPEAARADGAHVWWVKVETADGAVGWTDRTDRFGNVDACG